MAVTARATLTRQYEITDKEGRVIRMRTIEVRALDGESLMVLQSEDNPAAIEAALKENGWGIVSWEDSSLELGPVSVAAPPKDTTQTVTVNNMVTQATANKGFGCGGCLGLIVLFLLFASIIGACTHH